MIRDPHPQIGLIPDSLWTGDDPGSSPFGPLAVTWAGRMLFRRHSGASRKSFSTAQAGHPLTFARTPEVTGFQLALE
ncbi:MAG TPA: hypothetical protein VFW82_12375 [Dyella sp.]|nr:hypothetical protein [Dyella sp.]